MAFLLPNQQHQSTEGNLGTEILGTKWASPFTGAVIVGICGNAMARVHLVYLMIAD